MPRNRSEQLPSCPAAHAYADAIETWLEDGGHESDVPACFVNMWDAMPYEFRTTRDVAHVGYGKTYGAWRLSNMKYIRETYAT